MKPKLIGYDETPSVTMDRIDDGLEFSGADLDPRVHREVGDSRPFRITRMSETLASSSGAAGEQLKPSIPLEGHDSSTDLQSLSSSSSSSSSSSGRHRGSYYCYALNSFVMHGGLFRSVGENNGKISSV